MDMEEYGIHLIDFYKYLLSGPPKGRLYTEAKTFFKNRLSQTQFNNLEIDRVIRFAERYSNIARYPNIARVEYHKLCGGENRYGETLYPKSVVEYTDQEILIQCHRFIKPGETIVPSPDDVINSLQNDIRDLEEHALKNDIWVPDKIAPLVIKFSSDGKRAIVTRREYRNNPDGMSREDTMSVIVDSETFNDYLNVQLHNYHDIVANGGYADDNFIILPIVDENSNWIPHLALLRFDELSVTLVVNSATGSYLANIKK